MSDEFTVHVINPKGKTAKKKKSGAKQVAGKKKTGKKKTGKKRAASKAPAKRRSNPAPAKKKKRKGKRRSNPGGMFAIGGLVGEAKKALPQVAGMLAVAWAVRKWGGTGSLFEGDGEVVTSEFAGTSWTWRQYGIALAVAQFGGKLLGRIVDPAGFRRGAMSAIVMKFVWTEGIAKSDWGKQQFGTGDIYNDTDTGQLYWDQNGRQVAMQGGRLVEKSALDGLVESSALDGHDPGGYGHLMPSSTPAAEANAGAYHGSGYVDPYHAVMAA